MSRGMSIGNKTIGDRHPCYVIAEVGINHNGDVETAKKLVDVAVEAGCDAVKFQKRTPELCVPFDQRNRPKETPWGLMTYMEYKEKMEFGLEQYYLINAHCREVGIPWFASCWDVPSLKFMHEEFNAPAVKIASASLTDSVLLGSARKTGKPILLSTGMSTMSEIRTAVASLDKRDLAVLHCTSTYPCVPKEINLEMIYSLRCFGVPVGYSGHEQGLQVSLAAVAMGAKVLERHVTLDRTSWGTDHAASLEPAGLKKLVRDVRIIEESMGDGIKKVYDSELSIREKLRG